ncbi:MAG: (2Fe-2S)-binding protein [Candidatus Promineifilaceae bacterium]|nr:(2Fe-2S)-binding protein [Candidatus Promineifilaceae bacterium]
MKRVLISVTVNDQRVEAEIEPRELLLDFLRDRLNLTGAKRSCDVQVCGACTVLLDGLPVSACNMLAYDTNGRHVLTIEGLAQDGELHAIQKAFIEQNGLQCGFCTPGMILTTKALLAARPDPSESEIRSYLRGNLCRCTGYHPILAAVRAAAEQMRDGDERVEI